MNIISSLHNIDVTVPDAGGMVVGSNFNDKRALTSLFILAPWPRRGHDISIISLEILAGETSNFFTQWKDDLKFVSQNSDRFICLP